MSRSICNWRTCSPLGARTDLFHRVNQSQTEQSRFKAMAAARYQGIAGATSVWNPLGAI